jgi:hypothetical protein
LHDCHRFPSTNHKDDQYGNANDFDVIFTSFNFTRFVDALQPFFEKNVADVGGDAYFYLSVHWG